MKVLFDIDGIAYELELSKGETKRIEYKSGKFANVSIQKIGNEPTETSIGSAYLRIEFDNGNVWHSKDAVIPKVKDEKIIITDICWETDGEEVDLPKAVELPSNIDVHDDDAICNYLSDTYGWLVIGFSVPMVDGDRDEFGEYVNGVEANVS